MKRLLLTFLILSSLAACGSKGDEKAKLAADAKNTTTTAFADNPAAPGSTVPPAQGPTAGANKSGATTGTTTTPQAQGPTTPTTLVKPTATLEPRCVRKGPSGDTITLTVHTNPDGIVGYSTKYSDGSTKFTKPAYESGDGYGRSDPVTGMYVVSWKVPTIAPDGPTILHWVTQGDFQPDLTFKIVSATGHC